MVTNFYKSKMICTSYFYLALHMYSKLRYVRSVEVDGVRSLVLSLDHIIGTLVEFSNIEIFLFFFGEFQIC
jgi:hypothetical protein